MAQSSHVHSQAFWAAQILYKFTITLTKTSICLLYLRIFTTKTFRRTVHIIMGYVIMYAFASIIATIVQCTPLERIWDHAVPGNCINLTAFWYANASANIIGDFLILALPMPVVKSLQLPQRQRLGLIMVFALGGLYVSLVRALLCLNTGSKAKDQTYGTLNSTIWTTIEANTAIICACLPMLKSPLAALFPRLFPRGSADEYSNGSNAARRRGMYMQGQYSSISAPCFPSQDMPREQNSSSHSPSPENLFCLHRLRNTLTPNLSRSPFPRPELSSRCV